MKLDDYVQKGDSYLRFLCSVKPNRRTGSLGNRAATEFFEHTIHPFGYEIDATPFECLDYFCSGVALRHKARDFEVYTSPYSLGCDVSAELTTVSTIEELETADFGDKVLLMRGEICSEQLMPKNFVFYNPERHQKIIDLLESRKPAGIITATGRNPDLVGALYPFPLIVDGDFDIPSVYCKESVGDILARLQNQTFHLKIDAQRFPSYATSVIARLNQKTKNKIVITAHIDAYEDTPGALDNASGTVVLLLLAEMLSNYHGNNDIEIVALNGEDHYSAGGQMDYLNRYGSELPEIRLVVNVDDIGYQHGRSSYSFYECAPGLEKKAEDVFQDFEGLVRGGQWFNGDHMIFTQKGVPAVAFTSEYMSELMRTVTHTSVDTPDIIDCNKLIEVAKSLNALVRSL
jgi:aminopeptidase YwaD